MDVGCGLLLIRIAVCGLDDTADVVVATVAAVKGLNRFSEKEEESIFESDEMLKFFGVKDEDEDDGVDEENEEVPW